MKIISMILDDDEKTHIIKNNEKRDKDSIKLCSLHVK